MPHRGVVFIDYNSMRDKAAEMFSAKTDEQCRGCFSPARLASVIIAKLNERNTQAGDAVDLVGVHVFYATPHGLTEAEEAKKADRLVKQWRQAGTPKPKVFPYPKSPEGEKKRVHVQFVTDLIAMWKRGSFDIAVLATVDEDHRPAARAIPRGETDLPRVELAGWAVSGGSRLRPQTLVLGGQEPTAHPLTEDDYRQVYPNPLTKDDHRHVRLKRRRKRKRRSGGPS